MKAVLGIFSAVLLGICAFLAYGWVPASEYPADTAALPVLSGSDLTPRWLTQAELAGVPGNFPEFVLTDQSGRSLHRAELEGHIVVANFFFTSCATLCPRLRSAMAKVRDAYASDESVRLLSHSVTPEFDRPELLAAYAKSNGIDGKQWRLLTGERAMLERVTHEGYRVPRAQPSDGAVLHTEWIVLLDQQQRPRGVYNGTLPIEVSWLIRDIQLLREAAKS